MSERIKGILSPVVTPFRPDYGVDHELLAAQCRWLQSTNVGLAFLGTNSEANSLSPDERYDVIESLVQAGLDPARMMPGTGACDLPTAVRLTRRAVQSGCAGVLMLPPFYYKGVSDEGLYRYYSEVVQQVADDRLRIYLYHIPPVAQVGISISLVERLLAEYPGIIAGMKDSSGDWSNTRAMLERFSGQGFDVFAGSETFLLQTLRHGGAGCISATANVNPVAIHNLYRSWKNDNADSLQQGLDRIRQIFQQYPMIPALKAAVAHWGGKPAWQRVRPPLVELNEAQRRSVIGQLEQVGFTMPGIAAQAA